MKILSFDDILRQLEKIENQDFDLDGSWTADKHLIHCGQAIDYSISGYPKYEAYWKRETIGKLAYHSFQLLGFMKHDTNALTDGAPEIETINLNTAIKSLKSSIEAFDSYSGEFMPHHFYGKLSKVQYEKAHSLHFANHWERFIF
jgi:hypothetical protein